MWRALLSGASLAHAQAQDPWDEQSLLQMQSRPHVPSAATDESSNLLSVARKLALTAKEQSPGTVTTLVETINSTVQAMKPQLVIEHDSDQASITAQFVEITSCGQSSSYETDASGFAALEQCRADVQVAADEMTQACQTWAEAPAVLEIKDGFPDCLPATYTPEEFLAHAELSHAFYGAELAALISKKTHCFIKTTESSNTATECREEETEFDDAFCRRKTSCVLLHACHDHEVSGYESLVGTLQGAETARQAQFRSLSQVECLLNLITTAVQGNKTIEAAHLDTCDGDANIDHLVLNVESPQNLTTCPEPATGDPECSPIDVPPLWSAGEAVAATPDLYPCPHGQDDCPAGFCYSLYDVYSTSFHNGYYSMEECRDFCSSRDDCVVFEWSASNNNCGINNRGWSDGARILVAGGEDPGQHGHLPWYSDGVLQSRGQPSHKTCYPAPAPAPPYECPIGQNDCPAGFCYSEWDLCSSSFLPGYNSIEECRDKCASTSGCLGFEYHASRRECGINNAGFSSAARTLVAAGEDPGQNGATPFCGSGVHQSNAPGHHSGFIACYPILF